MEQSSDGRIRVLIVDDSAFQRAALTKILESDPEIVVVGEARDGAEAVEKTGRLKPSVVTMDVRMPVMDGLEATREIMARCPTPIVIVSAAVQDQKEFTFSALKRGALDFVPLGPGGQFDPGDLVAKIKLCSRVAVVTHPRGRRRRPRRDRRNRSYDVIGIAVSTGGPPALQSLLSGLPPDFALPMVIVQHLPDGFAESLAEWLSCNCDIAVAEARDGDRLEPGAAYIAPSGRHLMVRSGGRIELTGMDIHGCYHKPSADVMLASLAEVYGSRAVGVIMTGMGRDGAEGIRAIREAGGLTIAQDEASSVIYGMNKAATEAGFIVEVLPLEQMAPKLASLSGC